jgi:hypothetical protein
LVAGQQVVHNRRDHNGEENVRVVHDHTCGHGNNSVLPYPLKAARKLQPYLWVEPILLEEMYVFLCLQMRVDVDKSDI